MKGRIAIVVHGRFHAFALARALVARGHEVRVFTNYPARVAARFGLPASCVRSFISEGIAFRATWWMRRHTGRGYPEARLHRWFGSWARDEILKENWNLVHCFSGVAEEVLAARQWGPRATLMRGSAHIRTQSRILDEEERRSGATLEKPSAWMIAREEREYALAQRIVVLSRFAHESFISEGFANEKLRLVSLGANLDAFRPTADVVAARQKRIARGSPLRVLYVGAASLQKGMLDMAPVVEVLAGRGFEFRFVGAVTPEAEPIVRRIATRAEFVGKQPEHTLPRSYAWADIFMFPSLQDGFATVVAQANAAALPMIVSEHCGGPEIVERSGGGWVVPIRRPDTIISRLEWCAGHRGEVAEMVRTLANGFRPRDWSDVAHDFEDLLQ